MSPAASVSVEVTAALPALMVALGYAEAEGYWREVSARFLRWRPVNDPRRTDWKPQRDPRPTEWQ